MFVKKLIAILLLAIYGIPTAIGPHWHHHEHAAKGCAAQPASTAPCCCHHREIVVSKAKAADDVPAFAQDETLDEGGVCAICQFYASASFQNDDARLPECSLLSLAIAPLPERLLLPALLACNVRGPPSLA